MQIHPVTNQPNAKGKLVLEKNTALKLSQNAPVQLYKKFKNIADLVSEKPYNVYIMKNAGNDEFYNIAVNKSLEEAKTVKEYSVKVKSNAFTDSILDAVQDAIDMFEKYISKNIKG